MTGNGLSGQAAHPAFVPGNYPAICCLPVAAFLKGQKYCSPPAALPTKPDRHQGREGGVPQTPPDPPSHPPPAFHESRPAAPQRPKTELKLGRGKVCLHKRNYIFIHWRSLTCDLYWNCSLNPIWTDLFWFSYDPLKMGGNEWEVQKLSWNLISYRDWCQTWGFTTFRY